MNDPWEKITSTWFVIALVVVSSICSLLESFCVLCGGTWSDLHRYQSWQRFFNLFFTDLNDLHHSSRRYFICSWSRGFCALCGGISVKNILRCGIYTCPYSSSKFWNVPTHGIKIYLTFFLWYVTSLVWLAPFLYISNLLVPRHLVYCRSLVLALLLPSGTLHIHGAGLWCAETSVVLRNFPLLTMKLARRGYIAATVEVD